MKILHAADWHLDAPMQGATEALRQILSGVPGQIFELCRDLGMVINLHTDSNITEIEPVLKAFPTLNVVVAHPHDFDGAKQRFEYIANFPNAYMDISGNGLQRYGMLRWAVDCCGCEKILFGSDYPINSVGMHVQGVLYERLTDKEREAIFSPARAYRLPDDNWIRNRWW